VLRVKIEKKFRRHLHVTIVKYFVTIWTNTVTIWTNNLSGPSDVVSKATTEEDIKRRDETKLLVQVTIEQKNVFTFPRQ